MRNICNTPYTRTMKPSFRYLKFQMLVNIVNCIWKMNYLLQLLNCFSTVTIIFRISVTVLKVPNWKWPEILSQQKLADIFTELSECDSKSVLNNTQNWTLCPNSFLIISFKHVFVDSIGSVLVYVKMNFQLIDVITSNVGFVKSEH
jgi:hypothetical protein